MSLREGRIGGPGSGAGSYPLRNSPSRKRGLLEVIVAIYPWLVAILLTSLCVVEVVK